ncbi:MerR family transcriptional regulator [Dellaglioa sp. L3N]
MESQKEYKIGEFAKLVGLSSFTLRYYEKEGLIKPHRNVSGLRYYTEADIKWVGFLLHLKGTGMRITELIKYVQLRAKGDSTIVERREMLEKVKENALAEVAELQHNVEIVSHKIDWYDGKVSRETNEDEETEDISFEKYLQQFAIYD